MGDPPIISFVTLGVLEAKTSAATMLLKADVRTVVSVELFLEALIIKLGLTTPPSQSCFGVCKHVCEGACGKCAAQTCIRARLEGQALFHDFVFTFHRGDEMKDVSLHLFIFNLTVGREYSVTPWAWGGLIRWEWMKLGTAEFGIRTHT